MARKQIVRLDKYLADMSIGTRSEMKGAIRKGKIAVNGEIIRIPDKKIIIGTDEVSLDGNRIEYIEYEYYMLNKPAGVISATEDKREKTVLDFIHSTRKDLFPVGRLDKDTEGLLLITNDGALAHQLLSPKKHIKKVYYVIVDGEVTKEDQFSCEEGIILEDGYQTLPADLRILESQDTSKVELTIYEGKFHQVKRMFEALNKKVLYLKRLSMGTLQLDDNLKKGEYRPLTENEIDGLCKVKNKE